MGGCRVIMQAMGRLQQRGWMGFVVGLVVIHTGDGTFFPPSSLPILTVLVIYKGAGLHIN